MQQSALTLIRNSARVLVVRADGLGDNVLGSGFLVALNRSIEAECGFVGTPGAIELLDTHQLSFVAGVECRPRSYRDVLHAGLCLRREIDRFDPDIVLLPRFDFEREALAVALLGPRPRMTITWSKNATPKRSRRNWWLSALPGPRLSAVAAPQHEFARLQSFARFVGVDPSRLTPMLSSDLDEWVASLPELVNVRAPMIAVGIGAANAAYARRCWPPERFASVIREIGNAGYVSVLVGSSDEIGRGQEVCRHLPADAPVIDLIGRLPIRDVAKLVAHCVLYVGNDSGLGHVAAAVDTATVTISCHPIGGSPDHINAPERYHPVGTRGVVVRPMLPKGPQCVNGCVAIEEPCCIANISVDAVVSACHAQLAMEDTVVVESDEEFVRTKEIRSAPKRDSLRDIV